MKWITLIEWPESQICLECKHHRRLDQSNDIVCMIRMHPKKDKCFFGRNLTNLIEKENKP